MESKTKKRKALFIYPNQTGQVSEQLGICYLSAMLKREGHKTDLFNTTYLLYEPFEKVKEGVYNKIDLFQPDIICFSCRSLEFSFAKRIAESIKEKYKIKIIFGGIYPTIEPEEVLKCDAIDYVCVGEGEKALLELIKNLDKDKPINNIWAKKRKTKLNPLIQDLDKLPFPDRDLFNIPPENHNLIMTARGCPYSCTYCFNCIINKKYAGQKHVRFRSIENVLKEVKELIAKYKLGYIFFCDDVFTSNKERLIQFCKEYKEIGIPFACNARAEQIDRDIAIALKEAGCIEIRIGIETGNEKLRREILHRYVGNDLIKKSFQICKEVGLKTYSFNMIGLPFETKETIYETFQLNKEIKPDHFQVSILYPFEGSEIYETYKKNGYQLNNKKIQGFMEDSIFNFPNLTEKELLAYHRFAKLYIKMPRKLYFLINTLRILPLEKLNILKNKKFAQLYSKMRRRTMGSPQADVFRKNGNENKFLKNQPLEIFNRSI